MSRAEDLFNRIVKEGADAIDNLIRTRQSEELFLDFKRSADNGASAFLHKQDRDNLGRAISGFANSEGGVIVWGVDCRPDQHGADVAHLTFPLQDCRAFVSRLDAAITGCTIPPCIGVRSEPISQGMDPAGFAVTYVPKSTLAPHQFVGGDRGGMYFIRAGSSFSPTPHGVLAGLFGRRPEPFIYLRLSVGSVNCTPVSTVATGLDVLVVSDGPGIARDVFVTLDLGHPGKGSYLELVRGDKGAFDFFDAPEFHFASIAKDSFKLPPGGRAYPLSIRIALTPPFESSFTMTLNYGCSGTPTRQYKIEHDPSELEEICEATSKMAPKEQADFLFSHFFKASGAPLQRPPDLANR